MSVVSGGVRFDVLREFIHGHCRFFRSSRLIELP